MSRTPRILVVDDDESILEMIDVALSFEGYQVDTAPHGMAALELIGRAQPDLILLDVRMPVMDGREFSQRYREIPGPRAPIVVLTANRDVASSAAQVGAEGFLAKPFELVELLELVGKYRPRG